MNGAVAICFAAVAGAVASLLLKAAAARSAGENWLVMLVRAVSDPVLVGAALAYGASFVFYFLALKSLPVSTSYLIMVGIVGVLVNISGAWLFSEQLAFEHVAGMVLVLSGLALLTRGPV